MKIEQLDERHFAELFSFMPPGKNQSGKTTAVVIEHHFKRG